VPGGELTVLLACDSARGDVQLPNEALHVAAAASQASYRSVVAATKPVRDASTIPVVTALSTAVRDSPADVGSQVAAALHDVVAALRRDPFTGADPLAWAPYAFFGWGREIDARPPRRQCRPPRRDNTYLSVVIAIPHGSL
jgi:hypothetical protein